MSSFCKDGKRGFRTGGERDAGAFDYGYQDACFFRVVYCQRNCKKETSHKSYYYFCVLGFFLCQRGDTGRSIGLSFKTY